MKFYSLFFEGKRLLGYNVKISWVCVSFETWRAGGG